MPDPLPYRAHTIIFGVTPGGEWQASSLALPGHVTGRTSAEAADAARAALAEVCATSAMELISMTVVPTTYPVRVGRRAPDEALGDAVAAGASAVPVVLPPAPPAGRVRTFHCPYRRTADGHAVGSVEELPGLTWRARRDERVTDAAKFAVGLACDLFHEPYSVVTVEEPCYPPPLPHRAVVWPRGGGGWAGQLADYGDVIDTVTGSTPEDVRHGLHVALAVFFDLFDMNVVEVYIGATLPKAPQGART